MHLDQLHFYVDGFQLFFENLLHASESKLCGDLFAAIKKQIF